MPLVLAFEFEARRITMNLMVPWATQQKPVPKSISNGGWGDGSAVKRPILLFFKTWVWFPASEW